MPDRETLFSIDSKLRELIEKYTDHDTGEVDSAFEAELDAVYEQREAKLLAYGHLVKLFRFKAEQRKYRARPFEEEAQQHRKRARHHENAAERLRARAEAFMTEGEKLEDDTVRMGWRMSTRTLVADGVDAGAWPERFRKSEPKRAELKAAAEAGEDVPAGVTIDRRRRLMIS
jgi:hypothetical protein